MTVDWSKLRFRSFQQRLLKKYDWNVEGWDTETEHGNVRILANSSSYYIVRSLSDCLRVLCTHNNECKHNVFWNMHYDVECIMKFDRALSEQVFKDGSGKFDDYKISYIPKRLLTVRRGRGHVWRFTDAAQFYRCSLAVASEKYLHEKAHDFKAERADLFKLHSIDEIGDYCRDDARRTKKLFELFLDRIKSVGLHPRACISVGNLSMLYTLQNVDICTIRDIPRHVAEAACMAYHGGWIDAYKRGTFRAYQYDITSAYPAAMVELPDMRDGAWHEDFREGATLGFVLVEMQSRQTSITPLPYLSRNMLIYPEFDTPVRAWITLREFEAYHDLYDFEVLRVFTFVEKHNARHPYKDVVRRLFALKSASKDDTLKYRVTKELINSLYGKTAEKVRMPDGTYRAGRLFNSVYAATITALTRVKVREFLRGREDSIIAISTDGALTTSRMKLSNDEGLGAWTEKAANEKTTLLRAGVYQVGETTSALRGFRSDSSLISLLDTDEKTVDVEYVRPRHTKECLAADEFEDVGVFLPAKYTLTTTDPRRIWEKTPETLRELLSTSFSSSPVPLTMIAPPPP